MSGNSTGILSQVATSMMNFGAPMLLDEKDWEEAERMADAGLLQRHDPVFKSFGYSLTDAGIEAYNKAFPPAPLPDPVKAWGEQPPKSLNGRIAFIKRQCVKPLEDAYWLEIEDDKGNVESMTLSSSALDKKLEELGYDRYSDDGRIYFGKEDSYALYTCDITGALLEGAWSSEPDYLAYELGGFAWRRSNRFQMEERDWQEAKAYIERLDSGSREQAKLRRLIADSCFLDPASVNDTGLLNPGGGGQREFAELIALFDFMGAAPQP
jgi:hypothetical protein